jgi:Na+/H+ antiporter NhaA
VALFITNLTFDSPRLRADAALGALAASILAAVFGAALLNRAGRGTPKQTSDAKSS